jgi:hypothetical protein
MPNPQQPELRRSEKGSTVQDSAETRNTVARTDSGRPHGQDKGDKGGGKGGGVPPDQQSPHPS